MDSALYNRDILRLATSLVADHRLAAPDGSAEVRSPLCGSRIQADIVTDADGKLQGLALRANACALGQASAAILMHNAVGTAMTEVAKLRDGVAQALQREGDMPSCWPELVLLAAATDYPSRHAAILLPYDAILAAAAQAKEKA
ncbi:iron-sulfur cluster assembly scaffold protein [Sphingorhabdus sp.]|jgi:NifU-like protein involved in Fe-S cluster formation|uniref:iron-sulfur cluster assembly scaffold protein n=1 Tax=Sphingorhabdus sp. TaxID=1902408 RepID=UPI0037C8FA15